MNDTLRKAVSMEIKRPLRELLAGARKKLKGRGNPALSLCAFFTTPAPNYHNFSSYIFLPTPSTNYHNGNQDKYYNGDKYQKYARIQNDFLKK